nr:MAG TPA: hypothetical protein [Caudoviricetes sp.]
MTETPTFQKIKVVFGIILIYNNINFNSSRSSRRSRRSIK